MLNTLEIDWEGLMQNAVTFLRNGATNLLGSTVSIVSGVVSAATNFVIAFVFAMYIVLQKERLSVQVRKIMYAFLPGRGRTGLTVWHPWRIQPFLTFSPDSVWRQ